jgi:8-oxo-dGTP pyrophosphatase MutT (NUDIX family)
MQKYKVFINDMWIFFGEFDASDVVENEDYNVLDASEDLIFNLAGMIKNESFDRNIVLRHTENVIDFFDFFLKQFLVLEAAGGIVQHSNNSFLLIKRFGFWDFPKGKIESAESNQEAALREVQEETGVGNLQISRELPTIFHIYRYRNQWIVKRTYWFLMKSDFGGQLIAQKEEDILEAIWVPKNRLTNYLMHTYSSLKELVKKSGIITNNEF